MDFCNNCREILAKYLQGIPADWREQIVNVICNLEEDKIVATCQALEKCQTITFLSEFYFDGDKACIDYRDENGHTWKRCFDMDSIIRKLLPAAPCTVNQSTWDTLSFKARVQEIIYSYCDCCTTSTTTSTTTTSTTTTTTVPPTTTTTSTSTTTTTTTTSTSTTTTTTACNCPSGYVFDGTQCVLNETQSPTIQHSDYCIAPSTLPGQYSVTGTFLYDPGYDQQLNGTYTYLTTVTEWREFGGAGPFNRRGVWVDSDCNGVKNPLTAGQRLQITTLISLASPKTLYIGIGGDNTFRVTMIPPSGASTDVVVRETITSANFNIWHVFPVNFPAGNTYINLQAIGDGTTNDAFACAIYDNTAAELIAATDDSQLTILFDTANLIGQHIDIATCDAGWFLDTSGGQGNYVCRRITTQPCG